MNNNNIQSCDAIYAIKKVWKAYSQNKMNDPRVADHLVRIWKFADDNHLPNIKDRVNSVVDNLSGVGCEFENSLEKNLLYVKKTIEGLNEKRKIMALRENMARADYFKRSNRNPYFNSAPILRKYDIVMAPTQGGFHRSIVAEVNDEYVVCYPMTTAGRTQLNFIGCKSRSLAPSGDERFKGVRLTASAVKIPYGAFNKAPMGSVANNEFICKIIDSFRASL